VCSWIAAQKIAKKSCLSCWSACIVYISAAVELSFITRCIRMSASCYIQSACLHHAIFIQHVHTVKVHNASSTTTAILHHYSYEWAVNLFSHRSCYNTVCGMINQQSACKSSASGNVTVPLRSHTVTHTPPLLLHAQVLRYCYHTTVLQLTVSNSLVPCWAVVQSVAIVLEQAEELLWLLLCVIIKCF
jgi:hypothetical protein